MDTNARIIEDLRNKVGFGAEVDFMNLCKGVPLVFKGSIRQIKSTSIVFTVQSADSICLESDDHTMILHDIFISGLRGKIIEFNPVEAWVELGEFAYTDRGFGDRATVRVEPDTPIPVEFESNQQTFPGLVVDISLNGFGLQTSAEAAQTLAKGDPLTLHLNLMDKDLLIPCQILGVFKGAGLIRLAVNFPIDAPGRAVVTRYLSRRRAQIRQEIQAAYQKATGNEG